MTDDDLIPEVGDTIEYGEENRSPDGHLIAAAPRGRITKVWKNGSIEIESDRGGKRKLRSWQFTILSKGD